MINSLAPLHINLFPPRFELGILRVLCARDDHYTTETCLAKNEFCPLPKVALFIFCKKTHQMHVSAQDRTGDLARVKRMW